MTHLFIINPAAGSRDRSGEYRQKIEAAFANHTDPYRIEISQGPGDCTKLARDAAESGETYRIYACGGDGTLNEVVCGVAGYDNVAITCYRGGSGNDFVKIFGDADAFMDLERLLDCKEATFDLMRCNDDYSLNICSVGLDARIGTDVSNYKRLPLLSGFRAYAISAVINVIRGIGEHYVVEINSEVIDGKQTLVCVCNGRYYGGGMMATPAQDRNDAEGNLSLLVFHGSSKLHTLAVFPSIFKGTHIKHKKIVSIHKGKNIHVVFDRPSTIQIDGETITGVTEYTAKAKIASLV